jgi:hypothetical protein
VPIPLYRSDGALVSWISPILATPPQHCISLNKARMLKGILLEKLPPGSTVAILGAPAGAFGGEDYDEKWLKDNLASHDRPLVLRIRSDIGQGPRNRSHQQRRRPGHHLDALPPRGLRIHLLRLRRHPDGD